MALELTTRKSSNSRPVYMIAEGSGDLKVLPDAAKRWAGENRFRGQAGRVLVVPGSDGSAAAALLGTGKLTGAQATLCAGSLAKELPDGKWHFELATEDRLSAATALMLGGYEFTAYRSAKSRKLVFAVPNAASKGDAERVAGGCNLARDLINTPASDMGPEALEKAVRTLSQRHKASVTVTRGEALLRKNFPMIHAVGRAADQAPRLVDMRWGNKNAPRITLVGKGVCFDTGGLDIKPASGMLLMKKDMGGAANVIGLASMIMEAKTPVRLRLLVPAVENAISGNAFRPGDVLKSRKGLTVEIGNTDAEGRLVLADALTLADEEKPDILIDMATLTGAARVALGPDVPPFFTDDDALAADLQAGSEAVADPMWRLPLYRPYFKGLNSKIADINNVTSNSFAGSVTAALFLSRFVEKAKSWAHFDIYGWNPSAKPHAPVGGEAQCIRALDQVIYNRFKV
ncbi:MAG: M17 family metallopeptidase [Rhizobiaceae bacterium]